MPSGSLVVNPGGTVAGGVGVVPDTMKSQQIALAGKPPDVPFVKVKPLVAPEKAVVLEDEKRLGSVTYCPKIKATATSSDVFPLA